MICKVSSNFTLPVNLETCPAAIANSQGRAFQECSNGRYWSQCPTEGYLTYLHRVAHTRDRHIIDIGANKGYSAANYFHLWTPHLGLSAPALYAFYKQEEAAKAIPPLDSFQACGACEDCKESKAAVHGHLPHQGSSHPDSPHHTIADSVLHVYSYEASQATHKLADHAVKRFFPGSASTSAGGGQWLLTWAAVGDHEGVVSWSKDCKDEHCSQTAKGEQIEITMTTVDAIVREHKLEHVVFLKIDTEGYDPAVLKGAAKSLEAQKIGMLMFEYNSMGLWQNATKLKPVVDELAGYGYVCYMAGRPTLARMTNCWSNMYERREWSNVLCTTAQHFDHLEAMSFVAYMNLP